MWHGMTSMASAPAWAAARACSMASKVPSAQTAEMTRTRPPTASVTIRVTSARSSGSSEPTSPVCPLVISAVTPSRAASQRAKRARPSSSIL
jgi:hypothetical protein